MTMTIDCQTETPGKDALVLNCRAHTFRSDSGEVTDSAPGAHDYFDSSLAACKALTAMWFARHHGITGLERVETHVERDDSEERKGKYVLRVRVAFHGTLSDDEKKRLYAAVGHCPIHKLMTTTDVIIETAPLQDVTPTSDR